MSALARWHRIQQAQMNKFRQKFHPQALGIEDLSTTALSSKAQERSNLVHAKLVSMANAVTNLRFQHMDEPTSLLAQQARAQFEELPKKIITEDDPHFAASLRLLRAACYFGMSAEDPHVQQLVDLLTRHTYLMDHHAVSWFVATYTSFSPHPKNLRAALDAVAPRLIATCKDLMVIEAARILNGLSNAKYNNARLTQTLAQHIVLFQETAPVGEICRAANALARLDINEAAYVLEETRQTMIERQDELTANDIVAIFRSHGSKHIGSEEQEGVILSVPKPFLNSLVQELLTSHMNQLKPSDIADLLIACKRLGYRHTLLFKRLTTRQLGLKEGQTVGSMVNTLVALAHFELNDEDIFEAIAEHLSGMGRINAFYSSCALQSFAMSLFWHASLLKPLLRPFIEDNLKSASDVRLIQALAAISRLQLYRREEGVEAVTGIVAELVDQRGGVPADEPELIETVTNAVTSMANDSHSSKPLMAALRPLLA